MMRKLALGLAILALLLAALVGLLTWQFSGLVTPRIEAYLTSHGVTSLTTSEVKWRFNRLRIENLQASGAIDNIPFELQLQRVDVGYQWWHLFSGTIDSVDIGTARIDLDLSVSDEAPATDLAIVPLLPQAWLGAVPVSTLAVDDISGTVRLTANRVLGLTGSNWRLAGSDLDATLTLRELDSGSVAVADRVLLLLDIASTRDQPLELSAGVSNDGRLVANLALSLAPDSAPGSLDLALHGDVEHTNLDQMMNSLAAIGHPLAGVAGDALDALPALSGDTRLQLSLRVPAVVTGDMDDWLLDGGLSGSIRHRLAWRGWPDDAIGDARAQLRYGLSGSLRDLGITFAGPVIVEGDLPGFGAALPESFVDWRQQVPFRFEFSAGQPLSLQAGDLLLEAANALLVLGPEGQHLAVDAQLASLAMDPEGIRGAATLAVTLYRHGQPLLAPRLTATARHASGVWTLSGDVVEDNLAVTGQWQATLADSGGYQVTLDSRTTNLPRLLEIGNDIVPLDLPLALAEGSGRLRYHLRGGQPAGSGADGQRFTFNLSELTGLLQGVALARGTIDGVVETAAQWRSQGDIEIRVDNLNAGVAVEDIAVALRLLPSPSLEQGLWSVNRFDARLFGGTVSLDAPFELRMPIEETAFKLVLSDWQLGDIFALYAEHGLSGTGVMSGNLPVRLAPEGIYIDGGELGGQQQGGTIVYDGGEAGEAVASGNQQLDLALRLLRNFQYDTLAVRTDFSPSGDLLLGLQLAGRNPDEFDGQAVHFNINVEENLFKLLRALQLTDDIIQRLENRLQR